MLFTGLFPDLSSSLTWLKLSKAPLQVDIFSELTALPELRITHDPYLVTLPFGIFSNQALLTYLDLGYNRLELQAGIFSNLMSLKRLYLRKNYMTSLADGVFQGLFNLIELDLGQNSLVILPRKLFSNMANLEILELWENRLSWLPDEIFSDLSGLTKLYLYDNNLATIQEAVFHFNHPSNFDIFMIHGNPLMCDKQICWILKANNAWLEVSVEAWVYCAGPPSLAVRSFSSWTRHELQCCK